MKRSIALLPLVAGCDLFNKVEDTVSDLLNPVIAVSIHTIAELPDDPRLADLDLGEVGPGYTGITLLADATDIAGFEEALIEDAVVTLKSGDVSHDVPPGGDIPGAYQLTLTADDAAALGDDARVTVDAGRKNPSKLPLHFQEKPDFDLPEQHTAGEPLTVDLSSGDYSQAVVVVVNGNTGDITWQNTPQDVPGWLDFVLNNQAITSVEIPGEAFVADAVHVVAVTALHRTPGSEIEAANSLGSFVGAGRTDVSIVSTIALPTL